MHGPIAAPEVECTPAKLVLALQFGVDVLGLAPPKSPVDRNVPDPAEVMQIPNPREDRRGYILLDRDGTIIRERHYLSDPADVELLPNAAIGLARIAALGYGLIVVTNQSGIGRGLFSTQALERVHARLTELLRTEGVALDRVYVCPHHPDDRCPCRKPLPGLAEQAARDFQFRLPAAPSQKLPQETDPRTSHNGARDRHQRSPCIVIGDKPSDIALGRNIGATTLLIRTRSSSQAIPNRAIASWPIAARLPSRRPITDESHSSDAGRPPPDHIVADLSEAATIIAAITNKLSPA